jgi:hypothetical protein
MFRASVENLNPARALMDSPRRGESKNRSSDKNLAQISEDQEIPSLPEPGAEPRVGFRRAAILEERAHEVTR